MTELTASRTLVKSPPELWAECSDAASLSRHLDRFGEIRITRLEPETVVAWEGESASGTVRLEPSGWGTKVVLTAQAAREVAPADVAPADVAPAEVGPADVGPGEAGADAVDLPAPVAEDPEPVVEEPEPVVEDPVAVEEEPPPAVVETPRPGPFARLRGLFRRRRVEPEPEAVAVSQPEPEPGSVAEPEAIAVAEPEPEAVIEPEPLSEPEEPVGDPPPAVAVELMALEQALDSLGQAHHRPFSRA